ncbi:MAG: SRPBCC domain-containing protein [Thermoflexales bacterium]
MSQPSAPTISEPVLTLTRAFNAPRAVVFKAWTEPERLAKWWGPKGFDFVVASMDLRPGGVFHYCMRAPAGLEMWGKLVYREVVAPERLVFVNSFSDKDGGLTRHPLSATWPLEIHSTLTLTEQDGKTLLTLSGGPVNATEVERQTYEAGRSSLQQGMAGSFAQLDAYLEALNQAAPDQT